LLAGSIVLGSEEFWSDRDLASKRSAVSSDQPSLVARHGEPFEWRWWRPNPAYKEKNTIRTRGGVTGHNVRYVLAFGLAGIIIAFIVIRLYFGGVQI
jgi:hypothetical protein